MVLLCCSSMVVYESLDRAHVRGDLALNDRSVFALKHAAILLQLLYAHQLALQKFASFSDVWTLIVSLDETLLLLAVTLFDGRQRFLRISCFKSATVVKGKNLDVKVIVRRNVNLVGS
jgi:hypothetical protein